MRCTGPKADAADLWVKNSEELHCLRAKEILIEVEHVKAHRTEKERQHRSLREKFISEGNEKADELANERSGVGWRICGAGKSKCHPARENRSVRSLAVCSQLSVLGVERLRRTQADVARKVDLLGQEKGRQRSVGRCGVPHKYRCMRGGRGSKYMKMQCKCTVPKYIWQRIWEDGVGGVWQDMTW